METAGGRALTPARGTLLRVRRSSKLAALAVAATMTGLAIAVLEVTGHPAPASLACALAGASAPLALFLSIRTAAGFWRGPPLLHFPIEYAVLCQGGDAETLRTAAHVRGALGGAGHLHPARLFFPALAWAAVAGVLACVAAGEPTSVSRNGLELLVLAVAARVAFPPRAFWYRERRDGSLVVYPASISERIGVPGGKSLAA